MVSDLPKIVITACTSSFRMHCVIAMCASDLLDEVVQMRLISASHLKCLVMANTVQHFLINSLKSFLFNLMGNGTGGHANPSWPPEFKVWPLKAFRGIIIGTMIPRYIRINFLVRVNHGDAVVLRAWPLEPGTLIVPEPSDQTKSTEKIALILKGLPPSHHLIGKSHSITNDCVTCEGCGVSLMELLMPHRRFRK